MKSTLFILFVFIGLKVYSQEHPYKYFNGDKSGVIKDKYVSLYASVVNMVVADWSVIADFKVKKYNIFTITTGVGVYPARHYKSMYFPDNNIQYTLSEPAYAFYLGFSYWNDEAYDGWFTGFVYRYDLIPDYYSHSISIVKGYSYIIKEKFFLRGSVSINFKYYIDMVPVTPIEYTNIDYSITFDAGVGMLF